MAAHGYTSEQVKEGRRILAQDVKAVPIGTIQGATRIPPSGCGIAFGYGSCICHRCDFIFVFCGLFGVLCNVPAD